MRPVDADELQKLCDGKIKELWNSETAPVSWAHAYADFKDDIDSIPTLTPQNEALTIEQLRRMDGEPVWVDFTGSAIKREPGWFILKNAQDEEVYIVGKTSVYKGYEYYGKTWLAYRYPLD